MIIPYQVITGNYNKKPKKGRKEDNYTIPSDNRELQPACCIIVNIMYYTIPSDNRELQRTMPVKGKQLHYTIPSDNRELQPQRLCITEREIIPYQVITGNYNEARFCLEQTRIIPYQVITGNYN